MKTVAALVPGILLLVGCGSAETTLESASDGGAGTADARPSEAATSDPTDALVADTAVAIEGGAPGCSTCARLVGKVSRVASAKPQHGGKGTVYLAVFDHDPVGDRTNAKVVGQALLPSVDFTADSASVAYAVDGLPPRSAAYWVIAFLDDDNNASSTGPAPSKGDLVSLDGLSAPKVVLASAKTVTLDLPLTTAMPF